MRLRLRGRSRQAQWRTQIAGGETRPASVAAAGDGAAPAVDRLLQRLAFTSRQDAQADHRSPDAQPTPRNQVIRTFEHASPVAVPIAAPSDPDQRDEGQP